MKYKLLRQFMRNKNVKKDHILKDCSLVIDGKSYFQESYKRSGCQHILGGEYDRYASYLKSHLTSFKECNVECYVIFNGAMKADGERRREIYQKIIDESSRIVPNDDKYCEPAFVRDVYKQVLDELGIKYFICEYVSTETLFAVAKSLRCPVLTDYIENCLLGLSCITPSSIAYEKRAKRIVCKIHTPEAYASIFTIHRNLMPMFMTILDEDSPLYKKIPELVRYEPGHPVVPLLRWTKRQRKNETLIDLAKNYNQTLRRIYFSKLRKNIAT